MKKRVLQSLKTLQKRLDDEVLSRNNVDELSIEKPDPLLIASKYRDEYIALICALFSYGKASSIVNFLQGIDFSLLNASEAEIKEHFNTSYYRFQISRDIQELFISLKRLKHETTLEALFIKGYEKESDVMHGIKEILTSIYDINRYHSKGYTFLLGKIPQIPYQSAYKRWHMYLRWMVRSDHLDLGLWQSVSRKDLLMPLDVHTFHVGRELGLIRRKTCDFKAVLELTQSLKLFDAQDPVKYDFALYRIGQEKIFL